MVVQEESSCHASVFLGRLSSWGLLTPPLPPPARPQGNIQDWSGLRCSAARQNHELGMVAMTICLCHGGICELSIRCSWPLNPPPPRETVTWPKKHRQYHAPKAPKKIFLLVMLELGGGRTLAIPAPPTQETVTWRPSPPPPLDPGRQSHATGGDCQGGVGLHMAGIG